MKNGKKIFKISAITLLVLVLVTVIHIILVVDTSPVPNGNIQLTRVDFDEKLEASVAAPMQTFLSKLNGVTQTVLNVEDQNIVVGFDNNITSIQKISDEINSAYPEKTTIYIPSEAELAGTCPVINRNTATYKMIASIKNIF